MSERDTTQRSGRKTKRVRVRATCSVNVLGSARKYLVEIYDLSVAGMSVLIKSPELAPNTDVQIDFRNIKLVAPFSVRGQILTQKLKPPSPDTKVRRGEVYRCSLRFEDPITEKQLMALLNSFYISTPPVQKKSR